MLKYINSEGIILGGSIKDSARVQRIYVIQVRFPKYYILSEYQIFLQRIGLIYHDRLAIGNLQSGKYIYLSIKIQESYFE